MDPKPPLPSRLPDRQDDDLIIRAAGPDDSDGLASLACLPGYRWGTLRLPYQSPAQTRALIEKRPAGSVFLIALRGGEVVGSAGLDPQSGRRAHAASLGMGVHDDHQGRGIGSRLLAALLDVADDWLNLRRIELTVFVDNAPALALYRRHGFDIEGTLADYAFRGGAFVDAYTMARLRR
ncbi:GNAT family N-acetyltransferase [Microvirga antarctica]|uniref:GNAT family N-acetyltransferase n=1 Tax=Microvirga antarctica TaxID=2819233 RepID=UPI001B30431B|nr:GNAT family N-acetyltransferase [Microvirga antarctica]